MIQNTLLDHIAVALCPYMEIILAAVTGCLIAALLAVMGELRNIDKKEKAAQAAGTTRSGIAKNLNTIYHTNARSARR